MFDSRLCNQTGEWLLCYCLGVQSFSVRSTGTPSFLELLAFHALLKVTLRMQCATFLGQLTESSSPDAALVTWYANHPGTWKSLGCW